jgi:arylsulfatase A-like enzyme
MSGDLRHNQAMLLSAAAVVLAAPVKQPNIVFIMVDDMGWADLSSYGSEVIETPNIDSIARDGIKFTDAYSACVVCAPARSSLLTGKHMGNTSVRLNTGGVPLLDEDITFGEVMRDAGYRTGGFGKWGVGELGTEGVPEKQGFDTWYGYYHQIHAHYHVPQYLIRDGEKEMLPGNKGFLEKNPHSQAGPFPRVEDGLTRQFAPDLIFEETKKFIRESAAGDQPFLAYAAWTPPHGGYIMPDDDPAWIKYVDSIDLPMRARIVAAFDTMVDRHVGEVLALLDELEISDNTVVFFLSDHGADARYEGALDSSGPLRGHKRDVYEGGIRVPMIVKWPGVIKPGQVTDHQAYFPDVLPTFAALGGGEVPEGLDGISFAPTLSNSYGAQDEHAYLYWEWELYNWGKGELAENGLMQAARIGRWKAVKNRSNQPIEIYNLDSDIGEQNDLAFSEPGWVAIFNRVFNQARTPMRPQAEPPRVNGKPYR